MSAKIIDGKAIALEVRGEWKERASALKEKGILPGLAVVIIGDDPASELYVRNKVKACHQVGLHSEIHDLPADIPENLLLETIKKLNSNTSIHGIFSTIADTRAY